jgi:hypothetical protein
MEFAGIERGEETKEDGEERGASGDDKVDPTHVPVLPAFQEDTWRALDAEDGNVRFPRRFHNVDIGPTNFALFGCLHATTLLH